MLAGYQAYDVAVFPNATGTPTSYSVDADVQYCGYDASGDLFVDAYSHLLSLFELPKGGTTFADISLGSSLGVRPGQVQWDGSHITLEGYGVKSGVSIYRLSASGSEATVTGVTKFKGVTGNALQSWIQGNHVFLPYGTRANKEKKAKLGIWKYPSGGEHLDSFKRFGGKPNFQGVTYNAEASP